MYPSRLIYIPIEPYQTRYTEYTAVVNGMYERSFQDAGVAYEVIRPDARVRQVTSGVMLDYVERSNWSFQQVSELLSRIAKGELDPNSDAIYFEDFWTPGFEMIPYAQCLAFGPNVRHHVPVFSFCHAQSTDPYDFTAPMAYWMRDMEKAWAKYQRRVMCASKEMLTQWADGGLPVGKLAWCGTTFNPAVLEELFPVFRVPVKDKQPLVVFSSRWDEEKNPKVFLEVARRFAAMGHPAKFVVCSGGPMRSNQPSLLRALEMRPRNFEVLENLTKLQYFAVLEQAQVQFNCASQDFVSYTLLEATYHGCAPLYPNLLTFPDALNRSESNLYTVDEGFAGATIDNAVDKLEKLLESERTEGDYDWVWMKYRGSTNRKLQAMGFVVRKPSLPISTLCSMSVEQLKVQFAMGR